MTTLIRTKLTMLGLLVATAITGCGTDPIARQVGTFEETADVVCPCPVVLGQPSEEACRTEVLSNIPSETEQACMRRVYGAYAAELDPAFDCQYQATRALLDCIAPLLDTCPPPLHEAGACGQAYERAVEACPTPSTQAQIELNACFASRS